MIFESVRLFLVLSISRQAAATVVSRTAAKARSAQGASQFAAGYAAVRLTHHGDDRPVHLTKTR